MSDVIDILSERGFIKQCSDEEGLRDALSEAGKSFYVGIDPTGVSIHLGHLVPLYVSAHLMRAGHKAIILMGGGTARIGDPSGRTDVRKMLSYEQIDQNIGSLKPQIGKLIDFESGGAEIINNADWLADLNYIDFLREIGSHFSVNRMLSFEAYKLRLEKGLSFLEFNYQLLQSYDFLELYRRRNCILQIGGDDQWGNIVAGMELIRRVERERAPKVFCLTMPLMLTSDGKKMGKTEKGAVYLDPDITPVYDFYQYWRNVLDDDVERFLLIFTFLPVDECRELGAASNINKSKERLAYEVTRLIHGEEQALRAQEAAASVFGASGGGKGVVTLSADLPNTSLPKSDIEKGMNVVDLFSLSGLCASKSEARRLIQQGGARINGEKVTDIDMLIGLDNVNEGSILLKAGKKRYFRIDIHN